MLAITGPSFFKAGRETTELSGAKAHCDVGPFATLRLVNGHPGDEARPIETARQRDKRLDPFLLLVRLEGPDRSAASVAKDLAEQRQCGLGIIRRPSRQPV